MSDHEPAGGTLGPPGAPALPAHVPWRVREGLGLLAIFILLQAIFAALSEKLSLAGAGLGFQIGASNALTLMVLWAILRGRSGGSRQASAAIALRGFGRGWASRLFVPAAAGVAALLAWFQAQSALLRYLDIRPPPQEIITRIEALLGRGDWEQVALLALLAVAVVPLTEELIFRGVLYLPLRARLGRPGAALLVSALFAAVHLHLAGVGHLFILALVFTWLLESTGTLLAPVLAHALHNAVVIGVLVLLRGRLG